MVPSSGEPTDGEASPTQLIHDGRWDEGSGLY